MAVRAWNIMGKQLDWVALPVVVEMLGIGDVEAFINRLLTIKDFVNRG